MSHVSVAELVQRKLGASDVMKALKALDTDGSGTAGRGELLAQLLHLPVLEPARHGAARHVVDRA